MSAARTLHRRGAVARSTLPPGARPVQESATRREAGFTLVEMLVAIAVLAVLVSIVPRSFVFARSVIDHSRDWMGARLVADAVLNDTLKGPALQPGARSGTINGRRWSATIREYGFPGITAPDSGELLLDVRLSVDVSAGRTLDVETLRIAPPVQQ